MSDYTKQINPSREHPILKDLLTEANELNTPIVKDDALNLIIQLIKIKDARNVLEIGSAIGYSAIMMALNSDANILTIERDDESYKRALNNIKKANLESRITLIHMDALEYEISEDYEIDLLFIDAAKASYIKFFEKYSKNLKKNGIIIADNLLFHGLVDNAEMIQTKNQRKLVEKIKKFNQYLLDNNEFDSYIYDIGDGISVSIKK